MQDYLERCVNSALRQTHQNLQIILVNDGSTDNSGEICDAFARNDARVEVIHRENGGVSAALNTGLDHARGQWISFIDADDFVSHHFIEHNLDACLKHGADISVCRHVVDRIGNPDENIFTVTPKYELISGKEAAIRHFGKGALMLNMKCNKLFRSALWHGLRLPAGKVIEDVYVSHRLLYSANKIVISEACLYACYQSSGSITRGPFTIKRLDALDAWLEGVNFYREVNEKELYDIARRVYCTRLFDAYGLCTKFLPDEQEKRKLIRNQAINAYREIKRIRSYVDLTFMRALAYRKKLFIGRYFTKIYSMIFLRGRTYV